MPVIIVGQRPKPLPRRPHHRRGEPVRRRVQRPRGDRGQIQLATTRLVPIHFLQRQHIGVQRPHRRCQPRTVDQPVPHRTAVQHIERDQTHHCTIRAVWHSNPMLKALFCSILLFIALGAAGIWLRRKRGR